MKDCILEEGPHAGEREEHGEKGAAEMKHYELIMTLFPFPASLRAWEWGETGRDERTLSP